MRDPRRVVEIVAHDPAWLERFAAEARLLAPALPSALSIEHIGSTSVPDLAAKPIIDILVVVPDVTAVVADVAAIADLGYVYRPHAFADDPLHLFLRKDTDGIRSHHLHVFGVQSPLPAKNRVFRAYLAAHPAARRRYEAAKRCAAELHPHSRQDYGAAKEDVMAELNAEAHRWGHALTLPAKTGA